MPRPEGWPHSPPASYGESIVNEPVKPAGRRTSRLQVYESDLNPVGGRFIPTRTRIMRLAVAVFLKCVRLVKIDPLCGNL